MKTSEKIRTKGGIFTAYEWEMWRQATADEVAQLEAENEALKKDAAPFQAQINQRKTYKAHDEQS